MDTKTAAPIHHTATVDKPWDRNAAVSAMPGDPAVLKYCFAQWDSGGDPSEKGTYSFPHHYDKGGPANVAAVRNGLARLEGSNIPDSDKPGVRAHLQAHLDDARKSEGAPVNTKNLSRFEVKDADLGQVTAVFSTLGQIDSDGDVTLPGAFTEGAPVVISSYGHGSWGGTPPVGTGTIHTVGDQAILDAQYFMNIPEARSEFLVISELAKRGQGEWSYGYDPTEFSFGEQDGQKVRFLKQIQVFECSPVLRGAGVGTRTLTAKSAGPATTTEPSEKDPEPVPAAPLPVPAPGCKSAAIAPHRTPVVAGPWDAAAMKSIPEAARPSDLRSVYAWCDPEADPELKASYLLPHHDGIGGPANQRAVVMAIAALNSPDNGGVPEPGRKAAYDHLAAHMRDADLDPPDLRTGPVAALKLFDHGAAVLAAVSGFTDRTSEVVALRNQKGKSLSPASLELLTWIEEELTRVKGLLNPPPAAPGKESLRDDEYSTLMAAVARVHGYRRANQ